VKGKKKREWEAMVKAPPRPLNPTEELLLNAFMSVLRDDPLADDIFEATSELLEGAYKAVQAARRLHNLHLEVARREKQATELGCKTVDFPRKAGGGPARRRGKRSAARPGDGTLPN
jgi:hypothetical protein